MRRVAQAIGIGLLALPSGLLASHGPLDAHRPAPLAEVAALSTARPAKDGLALKTKFKMHRESESDATVRTISAALSRCRSALGDKQRLQIARTIERESRRHGYDPLFVQAIIEVESTCKPTARSSRGAVGLTQVRPSTAREVAEDAGVRWKGAQSLLEPELNVQLGLLYLSQLEDRFGDIHLAIAAYNLGPNRVAGMPRETARRSRYVRKILARYDQLLAATPLIARS